MTELFDMSNKNFGNLRVLVFYFPPSCGLEPFFDVQTLSGFFVCVCSRTSLRSQKEFVLPEKKKDENGNEFEYKMQRSCLFLLVDGIEETHTHTRVYTYMQSGWIESPPVYVCVCCCVFSLMPVMDLFLFLLFLWEIFFFP